MKEQSLIPIYKLGGIRKINEKQKEAGNLENRISKFSWDDGVVISRENWKTDPSVISEFYDLMNDISKFVPKSLDSTLVENVDGHVYKGTILFFATLSLYWTNYLFGINDKSVNKIGDNEIEFYSLTPTTSKERALRFANGYLDDSLKKHSLIKEIAQKIYLRILSDNKDLLQKEKYNIKLPDFALQPLLLAFTSLGFKQNSKSEIWFLVPNKSSLNLLSNLIGYSVDDFKSKYPILSSKFR